MNKIGERNSSSINYRGKKKENSCLPLWNVTSLLLLRVLGEDLWVSCHLSPEQPLWFRLVNLGQCPIWNSIALQSSHLEASCCCCCCCWKLQPDLRDPTQWVLPLLPMYYFPHLSYSSVRIAYVHETTSLSPWNEQTINTWESWWSSSSHPWLILPKGFKNKNRIPHQFFQRFRF